MISIILSLLFFCSTVLAHVFWCRRHKTDGLFIRPFFHFFLLGLMLLVLILFLRPEEVLALEKTGMWGVPLNGSAVAVYVLFMACYFIFYFGMQVESPTRRLMQLMENKSAVSLDNLVGQMSNDSLILPRINDLLKHDYIRKEGERYVLKTRGVRVASMVKFYERIFNRPMGG
jgi:hypothetical protein